MTSESSRFDPTEGKVLKKEEYPVPQTASGIASLVEEVLTSGGWVDRVVIDNGAPLRAWRYVDRNEFDEVEVTLDGAVRNSQMLDSKHTRTPTAQVILAMSTIQRERMWPVAWVVGPNSNLDDWLRADEVVGALEGRKLVGLPIMVIESLPPETLLLAGARSSDAQIDDISVCVHIVMEMKYDQEHEGTSPRVGDNPEISGSASRPMGGVRGGGRKPGWGPPSFFRKSH